MARPKDKLPELPAPPNWTWVPQSLLRMQLNMSLKELDFYLAAHIFQLHVVRVIRRSQTRGGPWMQKMILVPWRWTKAQAFGTETGREVPIFRWHHIREMLGIPEHQIRSSLASGELKRWKDLKTGNCALRFSLRDIQEYAVRRIKRLGPTEAARMRHALKDGDGSNKIMRDFCPSRAYSVHFGKKSRWILEYLDREKQNEQEAAGC